METALVSRALMMTINLRNPPEGLLHHSGRGSQYASHAYQALLQEHGMVCSMSRKENCWGNAPTERFFSSLKREWLTGNIYPTREDAVAEVRAYIAYYNSRRLQQHWAIAGPSSLSNVLSWVSALARPQHSIIAKLKKFL